MQITESPLQTAPTRHPITCELEGKAYRGKYWIAGKIMTVATGLGGKSRQVGAVDPEELAKRLLGELVRAGKA